MKRAQIIIVSLLFACAVTALSAAQNLQKLHETQKKTNEQELLVEIDYALGDFMLNKSKPGEIYNVTLEYDPEIIIPEVLYDRKNRRGFLEIRGRDEDDDDSVNMRDRDANRWDVKLNPDLPTRLSIDVGLGDGIMELGGMNITDMNLSNGLSSTELNFSEPVKNAVDEMELETGLGKFRAKNLGNAKFKELSFDCGLGSATLDFHGVSAERSEVTVDVGLGSVTLILPEKLGVRIEAEKSFLSGLSLDSDFRQKDGYYYTENWNSAEKRMHIEMSVGLGSISVERIE